MCASKSKVTAEMAEKVGKEELTQDQIQSLDSEVNPNRAVMNDKEKVQDDIRRIQTFQKGLKVYEAQHGEEALEKK
jgi:hypothetical protein